MSVKQNRPRLDLVMPVHNEGASIEATLMEWHEQLSSHIALRFIICEDGSKDNTKEVLRSLEGRLPMLLDMVEGRRGYGGAMCAGLRASTTAYVMTSDSDGQIDPKDFWAVWEQRDTADMVVGWRVNRADSIGRRMMSRTFRLYHRTLTGTGLHDPSCNVMLMKRPVIDAVIPKIGLMSEGFQWEFVARAMKAGIQIVEVPLNHRSRAGGTTVVYKPSRIPGIAWRNGIGLFKIWREN